MSFTAELTLKDRATMALRATYLISIFLPFIFLGPLLLFLADLLLKWRQDSKVQINGHRCVPAQYSLHQAARKEQQDFAGLDQETQSAGTSAVC